MTNVTGPPRPAAASPGSIRRHVVWAASITSFGGLPAVLMFISMFFQHESAHRLVTAGREDEARATSEPPVTA